jgi:hypothetical protein
VIDMGDDRQITNQATLPAQWSEQSRPDIRASAAHI